ncbi:MAG: Calx-beta domain-containing protein, partial [Euzebya sp.]
MVLVAAMLLALLPQPASSAPTGPLELISRLQSGAGGDADSFVQAVSDDGRHVLYASASQGLIPGFVDRNGAGFDLFSYDTQDGTTTLVSHIASSTTSGGLGSSPSAMMSGDGSTVAFVTEATDLAQGQQQTDLNSSPDIAVWTRSTGNVTIITKDLDGRTCSGSSSRPWISDDGSRVAFVSTCANLNTTVNVLDTSNNEDIFLWSRGQSQIVHVSADQFNVAGNGNSTFPVVSGNGTHVAFHSVAASLVDNNDDNLANDVYRYTIDSGQMLRVSTALLANEAGNGESTFPRISDDGQRIAYTSAANNLYSGSDTNGVLDTFLWTADPFGNRIVSERASGGDTANGRSTGSAISGDGSTIIYITAATDLVEVGTKTTDGIDSIHHVVASGTDTLMSQNAAGTDGGNSNSVALNVQSVSDDGTEAVFLTTASDLAVPAEQTDANSAFDMVLYEVGRGLRLLGATPAGPAGNNGTIDARVSGDGDTIAVTSRATDLTADTYSAGSNANIFLLGGAPTTGAMLSVADVEVTEGPAGSLTPMVFTVTLSEASTSEVTVDYATADVTTNFGPDYSKREGTLTFPPGTTSQTVEISVRGDDTPEETETFTFTLSNPSAPVILDPDGTVAIGTILDDDGLGGQPGDGLSDTIVISTSTNAQTALDLSQVTFADGPTPTFAQQQAGLATAAGAIIATDGGFADALASGSLQTDRPLLLTATDQLYPSVITELDRLGVTDVTVLGGTVAISDSVVAEL